jgi:hypothetical protein
MPDVDFAYACLPSELAHKKLKQSATSLFTNYQVIFRMVRE